MLRLQHTRKREMYQSSVRGTDQELEERAPNPRWWPWMGHHIFPNSGGIQSHPGRAEDCGKNPQ